jgi:heme exporter protein B
MNFLRKVLAIVQKDIAVELRTKEMLSSMFVFALLVIVIFNFAFELRVEDVRKVTPGVLWVTFTFAGMLGLNRSFVLEKDRGCLEGLLLCPVDRSAIYFGKMLGNFIFMTVVEAIILPIFSVLFNLSLFRPGLLLIVVLGTLGFAGVGTLFSAMAVHTRAREVMLPVLLFPVVVPAMIAAVKATGGILDGQIFSEMAHWLRLLVAFDVIFLAISFMTFDYVVEE